MMKTRIGVLLVLVVLGLICTIGIAGADYTNYTHGMPPAHTVQPYNGPVGADNTNGTPLVDPIEPYHGSIGADSPVYGLKLAFENLDDTFTFNQTERLEKEIDQSDLRLAELESALDANRTDAADRALDRYWDKLNQTNSTLDWLNRTTLWSGNRGTSTWSDNSGTTSGSDNGGTSTWSDNSGTTSGSDNSGTTSDSYNTGTGPAPEFTNPVIADAQARILNHQVVLQNLQHSHPDYTRLVDAYNRSQDIEHRFEWMTHVHYDLYRDDNNRPIYRVVPLHPVVHNWTQPVYNGDHTHTNVNRVTPVWTPNQNTDHTWQDQHRTDNGQYQQNNQDYRYTNTTWNSGTYHGDDSQFRSR